MKFRKKPVVIEASVWLGDNLEGIVQFVGDDAYWDVDEQVLKIATLEGHMVAKPGDWIVRGVQGEFYPCKPDIFVETYEPVE